MSESVAAEVKRFKESMSKLRDIAEVDLLCLDWLAESAKLEHPRLRDVLHKNIEALRVGLS